MRIKHYDEARGLIAGYETAGGKRVLFYSRPLPNGAVLAGAFHWDESRQSMWPLMGPGLEDLPEGDGRTVTMLMAGVKIPGVLRDKAAGRAPGPEAQRLKQFLRGEAGRAFSDGVMALYVLLDPYEEDAPRLARLKMPFGAMRMAAELATGQYAGFDHAEELLGKGLANRLRKACEPGQCDYRGRQFMIQRSGLFDMLSTHGKPIASRGSAPSSCAPASASADPFQVPKSGFSVASTSDNECFGCCGPGCWGCTGVYTDECRGHDNCVDQFGHMACMFSIPGDCVDCNSLISAIGSLIRSIGSAIADWLGFFTSEGSPFGGDCDLMPCNVPPPGPYDGF